MLNKLLAPNLSSYIKIKTLLLFMALQISSALYAHGDLSARIEEATEKISKEPNNSHLYYDRGLLHQQHEDYSKSLEDYLKSESLGNTDKVIHYRKAQVHYLVEDYSKALKSIESYLKIDHIDVKAKKLQAQILFKLEKHIEALNAYLYVINTMVDIRPEDVLEYCDMILTENNQNYTGALNAIDFGLNKLGANTLSLQLKKLDYLQESNQVEKTLAQYNYFILEYNRKEFWYYKKAKYLTELNKLSEANISLQLAKITITQLDEKFKNMQSIKTLNKQIIALENSLINPRKS
jgi:tetratricopeptide (TPR) repeat protein